MFHFITINKFNDWLMIWKQLMNNNLNLMSVIPSMRLLLSTFGDTDNIEKVIRDISRLRVCDVVSLCNHAWSQCMRTLPEAEALRPPILIFE